MSQNASGYIVPASVLGTLGGLAESRQYDKFWTVLGTEGRETQPAYGYSGYVVAVAVAYLSEKGIKLSVDSSHPDAQRLSSSGLSPVLAARGAEAESIASRIGALASDEIELGEYFENFTGDSFDEAGPAMSEALDYLRKTLSVSGSGDEWSLLFIG